MDTYEAVISYRNGIVVLRDLNSEYAGFWLVPMSGPELEVWWSTQETFDSNPDGALDELYRVFGETPPPHSKIVLPGELLIAETQDEHGLWSRLWHDGEHYRCLICCDHDSYLKRPDGSVLYHKGYKSEEPEQ